MSTLRKLAYLSAAEAFQWLPRAAVRRAQFIKLRRMLHFSQKHVPWYRESFRNAGVSARDFRQLEDLAHFPTITREQVVAAYPDGIRVRDPRPADVVFTTSGTSGQFMEIAYDAAANDYLDAVYARALFQTGYRPWHRLAYFWGESRRAPRLYERLGLMRKNYIQLVPDARTQLAELRDLAPDWVYVFPSSMALLARLVEDGSEPGITPRGIICHGELLPPATRDLIAKTFRCPVFNLYGAQEFNRLAWDCSEHDALHIDADSVYIEALRDGRVAAPGHEGELLVTGLVNRLMPLIRYRIGDAGRLLAGGCACGRGLPRLDLTEGRVDDILVLENGARIGPRTLAPRIEAVRGFTQYRLLQKSANEIELQVVWQDSPDAAQVDQLRGVMRELMGPGIRFEISSVDSIPLNRRGKLRKVVRQRISEEP